MSREPSASLLKALAVLSHVYGRQLSAEDARTLALEYASDLADFPEPQVLEALKRCRRELRTFPTIADIVLRMDDGRPGPEEAWAMLPSDEGQSVIWTTEMQEAYGVARKLLPDEVAARMAFREVYSKLVVEARAGGLPARWEPSLGTDPNGRAAALELAVRKGRLTADHAQALLPDYGSSANRRIALPGTTPTVNPILVGVAIVLEKIGAEPRTPIGLPIPDPTAEEQAAAIERRLEELRQQARLIQKTEEIDRMEGA